MKFGKIKLVNKGAIQVARKKKNIKIETTIVSVILFIIAIIVGYFGNIEQYFNINEKQVEKITAEESQNVVLEADNNNLQIHFFDVGQADSILLIHNGKTMLIDAGNNEDGELIVNNIKNLGIKRLDYVIGTHPHEDHIGGLDNVILNFDIGTIYMPKVQTNTKTFEDVLDAISSKNLTVTSPNVGDKFTVGEVECEVMLCSNNEKEEQKNLNLASIVIRASFKQQSYLFMGDSEIENEKSRKWMQTNVIKIGHHGSDTSSSEEFLKQVLPQIAIIQVGKDNKYDHPKQTTLDKLEKMGTLIYRTDERGNVLIESDGKKNKVSFY